MDREYYEIYEDLYRGYPLTPLFRYSRLLPPMVIEPDAVALREIIDLADKERLLRPDAKYFLMLNLVDMCLIPLRIGKSSDTWDVRELLEQTVTQIMNGLVEDQPNSRSVSKSGAFSSGDLLRVVTKQWDQLAINKLSVWSSDDD